jgi:hypothetical protein
MKPHSRKTTAAPKEDERKPGRINNTKNKEEGKMK